MFSSSSDDFSSSSYEVGPKLAGTSLSEDDIVKLLTTGGLSKAPHTKAFKGANGNNAKQVATYSEEPAIESAAAGQTEAAARRDCRVAAH